MTRFWKGFVVAGSTLSMAVWAAPATHTSVEFMPIAWAFAAILLGEVLPPLWRSLAMPPTSDDWLAQIHHEFGE